MNLADAIRKAANRSVVEVPEPVTAPTPAPKAAATMESPAPAPKEPEVKKNTNVPQPAMNDVAPEPPQVAVPGGNAVRLEIFLSGEQMAGMLKAIMAGQHSVLTLREAASYLRVSPSKLERLVEDGEIPAVEIDGRYRFPKSNLDDWLAQGGAAHEEEKDVA